MTVFQVCAYAAPYEGNFIKALKALGETLSHEGHKMVYAFPENAREIDWCVALGKQTDVYFLPLAKARLKPQTYSQLKKIYAKYPDLGIIHTHFELYDVPVVMTAPKHVKVFWHLHDALEVYNDPKSRMVHKVQYGMLHKKAKLLSVSEKHMEYVLRLGFPKEQAAFVPNGLDTGRIRRVPSCRNNLTYDFLIFGWDFDRKGVDLCVEAAKKLGGSVKIAVIGNENTEAIIRQRFGEVKGVTVLQPVADINALYADCGCFLHISRAEGLSYALLEAVYAGLPVICSDIRENQFAQTFETVTMVPNENVEQIAAAMEAMLHRPEFTDEQIAGVQQQIDQAYSISCWVKNVRAHYGV